MDSILIFLAFTVIFTVFQLIREIISARMSLKLMEEQKKQMIDDTAEKIRVAIVKNLATGIYEFKKIKGGNEDGIKKES